MLPLRFQTDGPLKVLCLGAHCDDIEIGAGGSVRRLLREFEEVRVHWLVLASTPERAAEARASAAELLADTPAVVEVDTFPENVFPARFEELKERLFRARADSEPDVVISHRRGDRHQDHRTLAELTWNTFRDHPILAYEIAKYEGDLEPPNLYVPLAREEVEAKLDGLTRHFQSQAQRPWFDAEAFLALMRIRGLECNAPSGFAEAFHAEKLVL